MATMFKVTTYYLAYSSWGWDSTRKEHAISKREGKSLHIHHWLVAANDSIEAERFASQAAVDRFTPNQEPVAAHDPKWAPTASACWLDQTLTVDASRIEEKLAEIKAGK